MNLSVQYMVLGPVQTNVYFLINDDTKECVIVDPADRADVIISQLEQLGLHPAVILLTHGHYDHIGAVAGLKEHYGEDALPVWASEEEAELLKDGYLNHSALYGKAVEITPDRLLKDEEVIEAAGIEMKVIFTPGHTRGGCCYYIEEADLLISGDTLFQRSIGRSDLPTGDEDTLMASIRDRLLPLPDGTSVLPGHGGPTTIGLERAGNPFIKYMLRE